MTGRWPRESWSLLAVLLVVTAALAPSFASARPVNEIPVTQADDDRADALSDPTADAWNDSEPVAVPLSSAPSGAPQADDVSVDELTVRAVRTDERLYVRLAWSDPSRDGNATESRYAAPRRDSFGDAAAVQFPAQTGERPGIAMGSTEQQVNVWYWNADTGSEELLAGGPGTLSRLERPTVNASAAHEDGQWQVVFARELGSARPNRTSMEMDRDVEVAFAVWNGSNQERAGRKSVSEWHHFPFAPEEGVSFYETVLWTVAGLATLVVLVVTATAVRRDE